MNSRWSTALVLIAGGLFVSPAGGRLFAQTERPNILWITTEDMSPRLGCYGDFTVPTPHIDALAKQSIRYTRAFGVYGTCSPNRHAIITGMYPNSTGGMAQRVTKRTSALSKITDPKLLAIPVYEATPPAGVKCFSEYLRAAGYYCTNNVKTDYQFAAPITAWDESSERAHWRNRPDKSRPFFAVFNYFGTHESQIFQQTSPVIVDPQAVDLPPYYPDVSVVRRDVARHYDNIARLDQFVSERLAELDEDGVADNTIVFFFSDHGDGLPRMKRWVYDSGIRVPLLVRFPDRRGAGATNGELVSFVDLAPTVLSLLKLPIPKYMQGQAFLGPGRSRPRKYIFACRDRMDPAPETIRAVRDHRFKYVRNYRPDLPYIGYIPYRDQQEIMQEMHRLIAAKKLGPDQWQFTATTKPLEELYDTKTDPHEIRNLASDPRHFRKLAELRSAHLEWTERVNDLGHLAEEELLKRLWPPDGTQPTTAEPAIEIAGGRATIRCETAGASIAFRVGARIDEAASWRLYVKPFAVGGGTEIQAQAVRLGWKKSPLRTARSQD
ncbi:MAG: sulfatase [Pirellulaceae bacterium]|jgi:arylsulfatase A-like enzyme|nr:sulfatase [Pirellulaceae bacterium]MDP7015506.1 sulfatase [Pirellulaceae bacterium]